MASVCISVERSSSLSRCPNASANASILPENLFISLREEARSIHATPDCPIRRPLRFRHRVNPASNSF